MKTKSIIMLAGAIILLSSCDNPMTYQTKVYEDGTFDKVIGFEKNDSSIIQNNMFGIHEEKGWTALITKLSNDEKNKAKENINVVFSKHFQSVDEMNAELNTQSDTLFHIQSSFEKKFRWFYTYIKYTETFLPINRFKMLPISDYLNQEDYQFIERLPNEGTTISKADSLFLQMLNIKIVDEYANRAIFNEEYDILTRLLKQNNMEEKWFDTLRKKREFIFRQIDQMKGEHNLAMEMADTLRIPLPREKAMQDADELSKDLNSRMSFMGFAKDGKYKNVIEMPWEIVSTNADSVSKNKLFWRPVATKFLVTDYVMYAESRKLNLWTLFVSASFLGLTTYVLFRKRALKK